MVVTMKLTRLEVEAMIVASIVARWPCPPDYEWVAVQQTYGGVDVECVKIDINKDTDLIA